MKNLPLLALLLPVVSWAQYPPSDSQAPSLAEQCLAAAVPTPIGNNLSLRQFTNEADATLTVELVYDGIGWLAFGFSEFGAMVPGQAVMGLPDDPLSQTNPGLRDLTARDPSGVTLLPDSQQLLSDHSITQTADRTILRFTKPLVQDGVFPLEADGTHTFLWAYGGSNAFAQHTGRGSISLTLTPCVVSNGGQVQQQTSAPTNTPTTPPPVTPAEIPETPDDNAGGGGQAPSLTEQCLAAAALTPIQGTPVSIRQFTSEEDQTLTMELIYDGIGWLALGFSESGSMVGSQAVMGLPDDPLSQTNPGIRDMTARAPSGVTLLPDEQQLLTDHSITQTDTQTILRFTKPLVQEGVLPLEADGTHTFLWAVGGSNAFAQHTGRGDFELTLSPCLISDDGQVQEQDPTEIIGGSSEVPNRQKWVAHGALMAVAWAILVPLAVGSSLLRSLLPLPDGMWFQIHQYVNLTAVVLCIVAFSIAVSTINKEAADLGEDAEHFRGETHFKVGLAIFIMALLQALTALFRPHPPAPPQEEQPAPDTSEEEGNATEPAVEKEPEKKGLARRVWEVKHRLFGVSLLGMAWYNCYSGLELFARNYNEESKTAALWGVIGGLGGTILLLTIYAKLKK